MAAPPHVPNHNARYRWVQSALMNPGAVAQALATAVALNDEIQANMENATDAQIQTAVEVTAGYLVV